MQTGVKVYSIQYLESFVKYCTVFEEKKKVTQRTAAIFSGLTRVEGQTAYGSRN